MIAGIYVRTSTVKQGEEGTSLETQEERARLKAIELGYEVDSAYIWRDTESGAYIERPGLNRMLQAVKSRRVDVVIVYDHDRLSRDPLDLLNIQRVFIDAGVPLEFVRGPSDTSPEGQLMTYFMGYAAQRERLQFMERSLRGREQAARNGLMPTTGGRGLYGYDYDRASRRRIINETEAVAVRMMFRWALEGISTTRIAYRLNEERIPTKTGSLWGESLVRRMLRNVAYTGVQYYGRFRHRQVKGGRKEITKKPDSEAILVEGFTPQLINPTYFQAVQERLAAKSVRRWKGKGPRYMMTGFTKCGKCGSPVTGNMLARGHLYYRCMGTYRKPGRFPICDARSIRADRLEKAVWQMVSDAIKRPEILSREVERHTQTGEGDLGERTTKLRHEIADLKSQQRRLIEQRQKDTIDQDILESQIAPVKLRCDDKIRQLCILEDQQKKKDSAVDAEQRIAEYCGRLAEGLDNLDQEGKRATFAAFGVKVEATRDDLSVTLEIDPGVTIIQQSYWQRAARRPSNQARRQGAREGVMLECRLKRAGSELDTPASTAPARRRCQSNEMESPTCRLPEEAPAVQSLRTQGRRICPVNPTGFSGSASATRPSTHLLRRGGLASDSQGGALPLRGRLCNLSNSWASCEAWPPS